MLLNAKKRLVSDAIQAALEMCLGEWIGGETAPFFCFTRVQLPSVTPKTPKISFEIHEKIGA